MRNLSFQSQFLTLDKPDQRPDLSSPALSTTNKSQMIWNEKSEFFLSQFLILD